MSTFTKFLNLFKWQPDIDGDEEFDIEKSLNENWDKVDTKLETYMTDLTNDVENYKKDTNNSIQSYKDDTDTQIDTFTTNITNKVNELEGEVSSQKEISISPTAPTSNESVWIKKGKNKFNADELFLEQTNHVTNNNSTNKLSITTNGNYGYSRYKLTIPEEYLNKEVSISFNGVSTINESQNNIRNTIYISSTPDESGDIMTQLLTTTKTKYSIKFTPNSQEIYITLYGTLSDYSTIVTIEMSEIQLELGEPTEYEDYIEKEIYVKNDNGVFERFVNEESVNMNNSLQNKVDKVEGKGLSSNDFTDEYKNIIDNMNSLIQVKSIEAYFDNVSTEYDTENNYNSVNIQAVIPNGYKFLCWINCASSNWITKGFYIESALSATTTIWTKESVQHPKKVIAEYLVIKNF